MAKQKKGEEVGAVRWNYERGKVYQALAMAFPPL